MSVTPNPTAALVAKLWEKNLPVVRQRVELLVRAAEAAATNNLSSELRVDAHAAAHKLAGSLGMYGQPQAGEIASRMEHLLEGDLALDAKSVTILADDLKRRLFPEE